MYHGVIYYIHLPEVGPGSFSLWPINHWSWNCYTTNNVQVSPNLPLSLNLIIPVSSSQVTGQPPSLPSWQKGCPIPTVMTQTCQSFRGCFWKHDVHAPIFGLYHKWVAMYSAKVPPPSFFTNRLKSHSTLTILGHKFIAKLSHKYKHSDKTSHVCKFHPFVTYIHELQTRV